MLNVHPPSPTATPLSTQLRPAARHAVVPFNLSEREIWPGCHEIIVEGELDLAVVDQLEAALARAAERQVHALLDLGACSFLDAGCLGALVRGHETLRDRCCQLLLYGVHGQVRRLLAVTRVVENGLLVSGGDAMPAPPRIDGLSRTATVSGERQEGKAAA
jgi:anti-anti-sigma factor